MSILNKNLDLLKINSPATSDFDVSDGSDNEKAVREITSDLEASDEDERQIVTSTPGFQTAVDITGISISLEELLAIVSVTEKPSEPSTYCCNVEEMNKMRISRNMMESFINLPTFNETVVGCFVKLNNKITEIIAVVETSKMYTFGDNVRTTKQLRLRNSTLDKDVSIAFVSNQSFTFGEFEEYQNSCKLDAVKLPKLNRIVEKKQRINKALMLLRTTIVGTAQSMYIPGIAPIQEFPQTINNIKRSPEPMELPKEKKCCITPPPAPIKKTAISFSAYKKGREMQ